MTSSPTEASRLLQDSDRVDNVKAQQYGTKRSKRLDYHALAEHNDAKLKDDEVSGAISFFNPTRAYLDFTRQQEGDPSGSSSNHDTSASTVSRPRLEWRTRDNRKGRHLLIVPSDSGKDSPPLSRSLSTVSKGIWRMLTVYAYWDVSWWIAVFFSVGCALFVLCGLLKIIPVVAPKTSFNGEEEVAGDAAFIGATLFAFAGLLLIVEASNDNQTGCFGWAIEQTYHQATEGSEAHESGKDRNNDSDDGPLRVQRLGECEHHHYRHGVHSTHRFKQQHPDVHRRWEWWPTWHELTTHYMHETGFIASAILSLGTIIFWVSGFLSIPQLAKHLTPTAMMWTYWLAFLVGGLHFVTSSILNMLEAQTVWFKPNLRSIGWWIGFWYLIGSVGWTLSASLGYCSLSGATVAGTCKWQSDVTLLWASIAFLIGSLLLWYEALDKYPVERAE